MSGKKIKLNVDSIKKYMVKILLFFTSNRFISHASVAQLVEQLIRNEQVIGSSPIGSSEENAEIIDINGLGVFLSYFHRTPCGTGERIFRFLFKRSGRDTDHSHFFLAESDLCKMRNDF